MEISKNIIALSDLILCDGNTYTWCYDTEGNLIYSNCPDEITLSTVFEILLGKVQMLTHIESDFRRFPVVIATAIGIRWYGAYEYNEKNEFKRCFIIGPVIHNELSAEEIEAFISEYIDVKKSAEISKAILNTPFVSFISMQRYTVLLHYFITGEHIKVSDINFGVTNSEIIQLIQSYSNKYMIYQKEQMLLDMIKNGDLNYQNTLEEITQICSFIPIKSAEKLREAKASITVFAAVVCEAACFGGLSPEMAYVLRDSYIQAIEDAQTIHEIGSLGRTLYGDFVERVYKLRLTPNISPVIRRCCDYIHMHVEEKIHIAALARDIGYTEYYLTHLFQKEMGVSFKTYVKSIKIDRAKTLLLNTDDSTETIAERLAFSTRSYFSRVFSEIVGMTPQEYRMKKNSHLHSS